MTKREKILDKIKERPNNVTFDDVRRLLESEDYYLDRISGSHHIFQKGSVIFVVPSHRNRVKVVYVRRLIELIEENEQT